MHTCFSSSILNYRIQCVYKLLNYHLFACYFFTPFLILIRVATPRCQSRSHPPPRLIPYFFFGMSKCARNTYFLFSHSFIQFVFCCGYTLSTCYVLFLTPVDTHGLYLYLIDKLFLCVYLRSPQRQFVVLPVNGMNACRAFAHLIWNILSYFNCTYLFYGSRGRTSDHVQVHTPHRHTVIRSFCTIICIGIFCFFLFISFVYLLLLF